MVKPQIDFIPLPTSWAPYINYMEQIATTRIWEYPAENCD